MSNKMLRHLRLETRRGRAMRCTATFVDLTTDEVVDFDLMPTTVTVAASAHERVAVTISLPVTEGVEVVEVG